VLQEIPLRNLFFLAVFSGLATASLKMLAEARKRQASDSAESAPAKRPTVPTKLSAPSSLFDEAEEYRMVTACFPIGVLTPKWTHGRNRSPSTPHILQLRKSFDNELGRTDPSNTLRVACSPEHVDRMIAELKRQGDTRADWKQRTPDAWPSFWEWQSVNPEPVELMDGQHRVEALKEYLKDRKNAEDEAWWLCDVYNQGGSSF
jgi:hypothetical protein